VANPGHLLAQPVLLMLCSMQSFIKCVSMQVSRMVLDAVLVTTVLPSMPCK